MTVSIGIQNPRIVNMYQLLQEGTFEVPYFQREYSWSKDHWIDFFEDVDQALQKKRGHFFGFMTLKKGNRSDHEIIEGQQRLTTVIIFLCAIRDFCIELGLNEPKNDITKFISASSFFEKSLPPTPKLTLSRVNKDFFKSLIQTPSTLGEKEQEFKQQIRVIHSNRLIFDCYKYFHKCLSQKIEGLPLDSKEEKLNHLVGSALENFFVATTEVRDHLVAYNMFQTINDRGLDLTLSDLLKLHICTTVAKGREFIDEFWDDIRTQLVSGNMNNFLRHYWLSSHAVVKESLLLFEIQEHIKDDKTAYQFLEQLMDEVETYEALIKPSNEFWDVRDTEIADLLRDLQIISATIPLPLLMAASRLKTKEFKDVIKLCTTFLFRYLTIGEQESKVLEKLFSDLAIKIRSKEIAGASQVREYFLKEDLDDSIFKPFLENKDIKLNKVAKYILQKIELHLDPDMEKFSKKITLEHILPKTPDAEWQDYMRKNDMDHATLVYKLGNQTLLLGRVNTKLKNAIFMKKTAEYKKSSKLKINKALGNLKSWTEKDIMRRQKELAKICSEIWKL